jgi:c-di-GMP-binding flagellar brake protein YcgR
MPGTQLEIPRLSQPLKLWERVELVVGDDDQAGHYYARIEDFLHQGILISAPEFERGKTLLREGVTVIVVITREDATYRCQSSVKRIGSAENRSYILTQPRNVRRLQRRRSVRIPNSYPLSYAVITKVMEWEEYLDRSEWVPSRSINISGHGVLIANEEGLKTGDRVLLRLDYFEKLGLPDVVVGICRRSDVYNERPVMGIELLTLGKIADEFTAAEASRIPASAKQFDDIQRNALINHIFQEQIAMRQKGLL